MKTILILLSALTAASALAQEDLQCRLQKRVVVGWELTHSVSTAARERFSEGAPSPLQICLDVGRLFQQVTFNLGTTGSHDRFSQDAELLRHLSRVRTQVTELVGFCEDGPQEAEDSSTAWENWQNDLQALLDLQSTELKWILDRVRVGLSADGQCLPNTEAASESKPATTGSPF